MGLLKITLDEKRTVSVSERRYVPLDSSVPDHAETARLVEKYKKDSAKKEAGRTKTEQGK
jgi:hypothetical protein